MQISSIDVGTVDVEISQIAQMLKEHYKLSAHPLCSARRASIFTALKTESVYREDLSLISIGSSPEVGKDLQLKTNVHVHLVRSEWGKARPL